MGRGRSLIGLAVLASALAISAAPAAAESVGSPPLYVATGDGYAIAFEVEGAKVSVLGLDATVYCSLTEPGEYSKPALDAFFPLPTPMREGRHGPIAREGEGDTFGSSWATVQATLQGNRLVGKFKYDFSEESSHCQTGGYYGNRPAVPFEAVRYVPMSDPEAGPSVEGESGIYFSAAGPLEVYLRTDAEHVFVRGSIASRCRFEGAVAGLSPLFGSPVDPAVEADGSFAEAIRQRGRLGKGRRFFEPVSLSGVIGAEAIAGFYSRTRGIRVGTKQPHRCGTGPIAFSAPRYVPALSAAAG
jgi:hypothetical protein